MDKFANKVTVHICAPTDELLQQGIAEFKQVAEAGNIQESTGFWHEYDEPTALATTWFENQWQLGQVISWARSWQREADQEAVSIEIVQDGRWSSHILYEFEDYAELIGQFVFE